MRHIGWLGALGSMVLALAGCNSRCCPPESIEQPPLNACAAWQEKGSRLGDVFRSIIEQRAAAGVSSLLGIQKQVSGKAALDRPTILALSGGALNGAFGAGFLHGWYETTSRPLFDIVTGVSTGALQAPLVFLDDAYGEAQLEHYFTSYGGSDILQERPVLALPFASSTHSAQGLERLVTRLVTADFLERIATTALGRGDGPRQLLVGTVELDGGAFHVWDMVKIAQERDVARFRQVLLASASQPPLYPPVMIDGRPHVDGGVRQQVFIPCLLQELQARTLKARALQGHLFRAEGASGLTILPETPPRLYMVVNGYIGVAPHCTQPQILDIGVRAVECLADEALFGNVWKSWGILQTVAGAGACTDCFHLVTMPRAYAAKGTGSQALTLEHVRFLFKKGREMGTAGAGWVHRPQDMAESGPVVR